MRGLFVWRAGCALVVFFLMAMVIVWAISSLVSGAHAGGFGGFLALAVLALLVIAISGRFLRRTLRPVGDLVEAAQRVEAGDFSARVDEGGSSDVRGLARAFNAMSAQLEADQQRRRSLLADVSHELRTPLTVVRGNLEGILDGLYPADAAHLAPILEEMRVLERLVDDLRALSQSEAGAIVLRREPTDLGALVQEVAAGFQAQSDANGVTLSIDIGSGLPRLDMDPSRIRSVIGNLLANALRYTPRGGRIEVAAQRSPDASGVTVSVHDSGPGIAPEILPRVFERFVRAPDSPGSGLGLAIARNVVEAHGGQISATSSPGEGTTIQFSLPAR